MVIILNRLIQKVRPDKWDELEEIDKKFNEIESRIGFPPKKRYRCLSGTIKWNWIIIERQWESMAKMEKFNLKAYLDPEFQKLSEKLSSIIEDQRVELYIPWPLVPP